MTHPKIKVIWNTVLERVLGQDIPLTVNGVVLKNILDNTMREMQVDGVFIAIGHSPNSGFVRDFIKVDNEGYIITIPDTTQTNIPGIFAAGDVQDKIYRQAVTAAGSGCMAALEAEKYIDYCN